VVERIAFLAREDKKIDKRSGVSQRLPISVLENVISNAERRALRSSEKMIVPRIGDIYAALPSITGKLELEYEGEMRGADTVARELIRSAVARAYDGYFKELNLQQVVAVVRPGRRDQTGRYRQRTGDCGRHQKHSGAHGEAGASGHQSKRAAGSAGLRRRIRAGGPARASPYRTERGSAFSARKKQNKRAERTFEREEEPPQPVRNRRPFITKQAAPGQAERFSTLASCVCWNAGALAL